VVDREDPAVAFAMVPSRAATLGRGINNDGGLVAAGVAFARSTVEALVRSGNRAGFFRTRRTVGGRLLLLPVGGKAGTRIARHDSDRPGGRQSGRDGRAWSAASHIGSRSDCVSSCGPRNHLHRALRLHAEAHRPQGDQRTRQTTHVACLPATGSRRRQSRRAATDRSLLGVPARKH
jgi:hypothetical protein